MNPLPLNVAEETAKAWCRWDHAANPFIGRNWDLFLEHIAFDPEDPLWNFVVALDAKQTYELKKHIGVRAAEHEKTLRLQSQGDWVSNWGCVIALVLGMVLAAILKVLFP